MMCIRSLYSRVFIPVGGYMTNTTIRVSKGIHNITFTVLPDTFYTYVMRDCTLTPKLGLSTNCAPQHSEPGAQTLLFLTHFPYLSFSFQPPPLPLFLCPFHIIPLSFKCSPSPPPATIHV